ncbi:hypothetical protein ZOSMA_132G00280 [Zostera marina]|uniref:Uncharacterized protein n=1 Tax=Zostera marina TaxID=29655 RepID=A0A0K9PYX3_ZOSMR|nr:hypothetical protein ZOSMA_132G00280 [Zostera marina]
MHNSVSFGQFFFVVVVFTFLLRTLLLWARWKLLKQGTT